MVYHPRQNNKSFSKAERRVLSSSDKGQKYGGATSVW